MSSDGKREPFPPLVIICAMHVQCCSCVNLTVIIIVRFFVYYKADPNEGFWRCKMRMRSFLCSVFRLLQISLWLQTLNLRLSCARTVKGKKVSFRLFLRLSRTVSTTRITNLEEKFFGRTAYPPFSIVTGNIEMRRGQMIVFLHLIQAINMKISKIKISEVFKIKG